MSSHANALQYSAPSWDRSPWLALVLVSLLAHLLPLILIVLPPGNEPSVTPPSRTLELAFAPAPQMRPPLPDAVSEPPAVAPKPPSAPVLEKPPAAPEIIPPDPKQAPVPPPATPEKKPPEPELAKPAPAGPEEPFGKPNRNFVSDLAAGQKDTPKNATNIGTVNSEAADHEPKDKPFGAPTMKGETGEVDNSGRRGETGQLAPLVDPRIGSAKKEGSPTPGRPPQPDTGYRKKELPPPELAAQKPAPVAKPEETPAKPAAPPEPIASKPPPQEDPAPQENKNAVTVDVTPSEVAALKPKAKPKPKQQERPDPPKPAVLVRNERPTPAAQNEPRPEPPLDPQLKPKPRDPELERVLAILQHMEGGKAAQDPMRSKDGWGAFEGQAGITGDGRMRPGEREAVGDVQTEHHATVAARKGEVAFSKTADPEAVYLKDYLGRMNQRWKVVMISDGHTVRDYGEVVMRMSFDRTGKLLEASEVKRSGDISDQAVGYCKQGITEVDSPGPFPPALSGKEKITWTICFLYR